jgi:acetylglutamate kinase
MKVILKLSGKMLEDAGPRREFCRQIKPLQASGNDIVIVHGAGKQLSALSKQLAIPVVQHQGRRVTDEKTIAAANLAFSAVNRELVALLTSYGLGALGLTGFDAGLTESVRRGPMPVTEPDGTVRHIDFGYVAEIRRVDGRRLQQLLELGLLPVICSLCSDSAGQILNINADTLASEIAIGWGADRLISLSDVDGIFLDPSDSTTRLARLTCEEARQYLAEGRFREGMLPKIQTALKALANGVKTFQVASGLAENGVRNAIEHDSGTILTGGDQAADRCV